VRISDPSAGQLAAAPRLIRQGLFEVVPLGVHNASSGLSHCGLKEPNVLAELRGRQ
jgi:hypothetical protein